MSEGAAHTGSAAVTDKPPLDDVMLAMDVVDTLRRRERLVTTELDEAGREQDLMRRLRRIYAQQGIDVPDHILREGVAALKQGRFTYAPPPVSLATRLAHLYVTRARWGKWVFGAAAAMALVVAAGYYTFIAPDAALAERLAEKHAQVVALAATDHARETVTRVFNAGEAALRSEDGESARQALALLDELRLVLDQDYTIQIVNRQDERSGVWRVPDINTQARNYYIIVEALDATGRILTVPIENEETGSTDRVTAWGLRVDATTFDAVAQDKKDNGIIENSRVGNKKTGHLRPSYSISTTGGAITRW